MPKTYWGEIKDPVHGYVYVTDDSEPRPSGKAFPDRGEPGQS